MVSKKSSFQKKFSLDIDKASFIPVLIILTKDQKTISIPNPTFNTMEKVFRNRKIEYEDTSAIEVYVKAKPSQNELEEDDTYANQIKMKQRLLKKKIKRITDIKDTSTELLKVKATYNEKMTKEMFNDINERELRKKKRLMAKKYNALRSKKLSST